MQNRRTHHFTEGKVITGLLPTGEYGALRDQDDGRIRGYGHTRLAAIADMVEAISNTEEEERRSYADFQLDHARDYRKHETV